VARIDKDRGASATGEESELVEIDADELEEARRDPRIIALAERADRVARELPHSSDR